MLLRIHLVNPRHISQHILQQKLRPTLLMLQLIHPLCLRLIIPLESLRIPLRIIQHTLQQRRQQMQPMLQHIHQVSHLATSRRSRLQIRHLRRRRKLPLLRQQTLLQTPQQVRQPLRQHPHPVFLRHTLRLTRPLVRQHILQVRLRLAALLSLQRPRQLSPQLLLQASHRLSRQLTLQLGHQRLRLRILRQLHLLILLHILLQTRRHSLQQTLQPLLLQTLLQDRQQALQRVLRVYLQQIPLLSRPRALRRIHRARLRHLLLRNRLRGRQLNLLHIPQVCLRQFLLLNPLQFHQHLRLAYRQLHPRHLLRQSLLPPHLRILRQTLQLTLQVCLLVIRQRTCPPSLPPICQHILPQSIQPNLRRRTLHTRPLTLQPNTPLLHPRLVQLISQHMSRNLPTPQLTNRRSRRAAMARVESAIPLVIQRGFQPVTQSTIRSGILRGSPPAIPRGFVAIDARNIAGRKHG